MMKVGRITVPFRCFSVLVVVETVVVTIRITATVTLVILVMRMIMMVVFSLLYLPTLSSIGSCHCWLLLFLLVSSFPVFVSTYIYFTSVRKGERERKCMSVKSEVTRLNSQERHTNIPFLKRTQDRLRDNE